LHQRRDRSDQLVVTSETLDVLVRPLVEAANPHQIIFFGSYPAGTLTGAADQDDNLIWFTEQCPSHALRLKTYRQDTDPDLGYALV